MGKCTRSCPICAKAITWDGNAFRPFCSDRCRLIDLQGWLDERYRISQTNNPDSDILDEQNEDQTSDIYKL